MGNDSYPILLAPTAITTLGSNFLYVICVNRTLAGTMVVNDGAAARANFAVGTTPGNYHLVPNGGRYSNLNIVLSAADDVTVYIKKA